jgi:hypothetical protein
MLNFQSYQASGLSKMFDLDTIPVHAGIYGGIKKDCYRKKFVYMHYEDMHLVINRNLITFFSSYKLEC